MTFSNPQKHSAQRPALFSNSVVEVQLSKAYTNINMARERISFIFNPRDTLLSFKVGIRFVKDAVACTSAILAETILQGIFQLVTFLSCHSFTLTSQ